MDLDQNTQIYLKINLPYNKYTFSISLGLRRRRDLDVFEHTGLQNKNENLTYCKFVFKPS